MSVETGIPPIGRVGWGTHFCHFYRTADDLAETLVPFFKAGIEANEACLWVTAEPLHKEQARAALNAHVANLDGRINAGQIAIYDHVEWYERYGSLSRSDVARMWVESAQNALSRGHTGLRLTGNTAFLESDSWNDFVDYENCLREAFLGQRLVALCSYHSDRCDSDAVLDVVQAHDFALARRRGIWEVVESASVKQTKHALAMLNAELESRVNERTRDLTEALTHQRFLTAELSHRVKNTIASVQALVDQSLRNGNSIPEARTTIRGRLSALAQVQDELAAADWRGVKLRRALNIGFGPHGERIELNAHDEMLAPRAALDLALVFHELTTNAARYGALRSAGRVQVSVKHVSAEHVSAPHDMLVLTWRETGGPNVGQAGHEGFGMRLIRQIIAHDLRGECEFAFDSAGLVCTLRIPASEALVSPACCTHGH